MQGEIFLHTKFFSLYSHFLYVQSVLTVLKTSERLTIELKFSYIKGISFIVSFLAMHVKN